MLYYIKDNTHALHPLSRNQEGDFILHEYLNKLGYDPISHLSNITAEEKAWPR
ncbi:protein of unknown function [Xenorhabdus doucetiae]|uniref:Uncharacterized protein n=1 Tax=Xenorhabdus doucetiae TaxID=351671 RepID=A0A068QNN0_9GAMM|nr:protein of unknown function [Xenorhabdus doucetiae]